MVQALGTCCSGEETICDVQCANGGDSKQEAPRQAWVNDFGQVSSSSFHWVKWQVTVIPLSDGSSKAPNEVQDVTAKANHKAGM